MAKTEFDISTKAVFYLAQFLLYYENDIAAGINGFGKLKPVFTELFGDRPSRNKNTDNNEAD